MKNIEQIENLGIAYRYEGIKHSWGTDEYGNPLTGYQLRVELREYQIIKRTPKGFWIGYAWGYGSKFRFVLSNAKKKFAHETKEGAIESFVVRKNSQIRILKNQLECAERELEIFNHKKASNIKKDE